MYIVVAIRRVVRDGWTTHNPLPTFYLNEDTQGIVDAEHARQVAVAILGADCEISVAKL